MARGKSSDAEDQDWRPSSQQSARTQRVSSSYLTRSSQKASFQKFKDLPSSPDWHGWKTPSPILSNRFAILGDSDDDADAEKGDTISPENEIDDEAEKYDGSSHMFGSGPDLLSQLISNPSTSIVEPRAAQVLDPFSFHSDSSSLKSPYHSPGNSSLSLDESPSQTREKCSERVPSTVAILSNLASTPVADHTQPTNNPVDKERTDSH